MADTFDPYREALIVESETIWPEDLAGVSAEQRRQIEQRLHADPEHAGHLEYVRLHAGFCRRITVTPEDLQRVQQQGVVP
jgi:hypothetical protein